MTRHAPGHSLQPPWLPILRSAYAEVDGDEVHLVGQVTALDGSWFVRLEADGPADATGDVGRQLAQDLLAKGADGILGDVRAGEASPPADR